MSNNTTRSTKGRKSGFFVQYEGPRGGKHSRGADCIQVDAGRLFYRIRGRWYSLECCSVASIITADGIQLYTKDRGARLPAVVLISTALREYKDRRGA